MWKKSFISTILFNVMLFQAAFSKYVETSLEYNEDKNVLEAYTNIDKSVKRLANNAVKMALPYIMEANEHLNLTSNCKNELLYLISEIRKFKLSAVHLLDASGKIPSGIFMGNFHLMGNYDECLSTTFKRKDGTTVFDGQYCMLHLKPMLPKKREGLAVRFGTQNVVDQMKNPSDVFQAYASLISVFYTLPIHLGVCVPSGCTIDDMELTVKYFSQKFYLNGTVAYCNRRGEISFPTGRIIAISAFSLIGLLLIIGTFLDYYSTEKNIKIQAMTAKFLLCFSVLRNFPKLTNTKISENSMTCLNGIRVLSLFYVILAHHYYTTYQSRVIENGVNYFNAVPTFFFQIILNSVFTVDVFFFIGGLMQCYIRLKMQKSTFIQVIIHRLWRMYPTYIFGILIIYLLQAFGPLGGVYEQEYSSLCDKKWWTNMLFINNFFAPGEACALHTWYIAVDMQLFLLSLFTVPVFFRNPKRGILLNSGMIVIGICSTVVWVMQKREMPSLLLINWDPDEYDRYMVFYFAIIPHIAPYFAGIILGYILYEKKGLKMSKITLFIGWTLSTAAFLSMLFITKRWNKGIEYTPTESSLYYAFSRLLYVCAVGWMILCCIIGQGGIINYILSLKIWIPLCRLSYMAYIVSYTLQMFYITNVKVTPDTQIMATIWRYAGDITIICLMSFAMVLAVECPFIAMEKLIFYRKPSEEKTKANKCTIKDNITLESHWNHSDNHIGNHDAAYQTEKFNFETNIEGRNNSGFQDINPKSTDSEMKT